jgi:NADH-quinone oxidoreductase subunit J
MLSIVFYVSLALVLVSALCVIFAKNPVHSVLFLIFTFFNAAGIMVMLEAEYVAMITIIVYVGAVVTLFLFVVMMLDIDLAEIKKKLPKTTSLIALFCVVFLGVFYVGLTRSEIHLPEMFIDDEYTPPLFQNAANQIGKVLYTDYVLEFQIAGLILFMAMIGSITLVHRKSNKMVRRQNITQQIMRTKKNSIRLVDVKSGSGVKI